LPGLSPPSSRKFAHISLALVGLMWVLPFLYPAHAYPITTFHQEWLAGLLGLIAASWLLWPPTWQRLAIPGVVLLPLGMLLLGVLQWSQGKLAYPGQAGLLAVYLLWAALLMLLGQRLRNAFGLPALAMTLAACMVVGAELNAASGIIQHFGWHTPLDHWITRRIASQTYGNLAQPNHFADQLALGIVSLAGLYASGRLTSRPTIMLVLPLLFTLTLSGSRSGGLYLLWLAGSAWWWQKRQPELRPLWYFGLWLLIGFAAMHGLIKLPLFQGTGDASSSWGRLYQESGGNSIRLFLWQEALHIWAEHPWLGTGFGQFGWQHFLLGPEWRNPVITGYYNNAHNLLFQLGAEFGLAGVLLLLSTLLAWLLRSRQEPRTLWHWWGYSMLAVLLIHSLLEYPLWYSYFLGIAALLLGMLDRATLRLSLPLSGWLATAPLILIGLILSFSLHSGYRELENLLSHFPTRELKNDRTVIEQDQAVLNRLAASPLLRPYAELYLNTMYTPNSINRAYKQALNQRVLHCFPFGQPAYREMLLLALSDRTIEAQQVLEQALWSYPEEFPRHYDLLVQLAQNNPARYEGLLKFAQQKYTEYQGAVSAR